MAECDVPACAEASSWGSAERRAYGHEISAGSMTTMGFSFINGKRSILAKAKGSMGDGTAIRGSQARRWTGDGAVEQSAVGAVSGRKSPPAVEIDMSAGRLPRERADCEMAERNVARMVQQLMTFFTERRPCMAAGAR